MEQGHVKEPCPGARARCKHTLDSKPHATSEAGPHQGLPVSGSDIIPTPGPVPRRGNQAFQAKQEAPSLGGRGTSLRALTRAGQQATPRELPVQLGTARKPGTPGTTTATNAREHTCRDVQGPHATAAGASPRPGCTCPRSERPGAGPPAARMEGKAPHRRRFCNRGAGPCSPNCRGHRGERRAEGDPDDREERVRHTDAARGSRCGTRKASGPGPPAGSQDTPFCLTKASPQQTNALSALGLGAGVAKARVPAPGRDPPRHWPGPAQGPR